MISLDIACSFWSAAFLPLLSMRSLTSTLQAFKVRDISLRLSTSRQEPTTEEETEKEEEEEEEEAAAAAAAGAHEGSAEEHRHHHAGGPWGHAPGYTKQWQHKK